MSPSSKMMTQIRLLILLMAGIQRAAGGNMAIVPPAAPPSATRPAAHAPAAATLTSGVQPAEARLYDLLYEVNYGTSPAAASILVIPAREMDAQTFARIVEDLSIMSRIIEKSLQGRQEERFNSGIIGELQQNLMLPSDGAGPRILRSSGGRPRPMYIGGYGVVFSVRVGFPLVPPPDAPEPDKTTEQRDRVWAQVQQELRDPQAANRRRQTTAPESVYDAEAVEGLRTTLTALLKHASNIRDLEPDAWLTILVQGPASTASDRPQTSPYGANSVYGELMYAPGGEEGRTLMTVWARKADIDQYAKGQLDDAQFQQHVQIVTQ